MKLPESVNPWRFGLIAGEGSGSMPIFTHTKNPFAPNKRLLVYVI